MEEDMQKIKKMFDKFNNAVSGPRKMEFILALVIVFVASFVFCFLKDFKLTVMQSLNFDDCLFSGKIFRFYSEVNRLALSGYYGPDWPQTLLAGANYSIINYATLGIVCLPVYAIEHLFGVAVPFWVYEFIVKLLYAVLMVYMTKIVYDICKQTGHEEKDAKWVSLCYLSSPVFLYSSIMISHLDIFSIVFLLLGIRCMVKGDKRGELIFFMISVSYKPFVILGIIPMLLLQEKRILRLIRNLLIVVAGILLQGIVFHFDPGYGKTQKFMSETYDFVGRFFAAGIEFERNAYDSVASYFIIAFVVICVAAYMIRNKNWQYTFFLPMLTMGAFVLFVKWHPNWMVLLVPYMVLLMSYTFHKRLLCILECIFSLFLIIVSAFGWAGFYDIEIINGGVLPQLLGAAANGKYDIASVLTRKLPQLPADFYSSLLAAVMIGMLFVYVVDCLFERSGKHKKTENWERCAVWCRVLPALGFMAYSVLTCIK